LSVKGPLEGWALREAVEVTKTIGLIAPLKSKLAPKIKRIMNGYVGDGEPVATQIVAVLKRGLYAS